jgi:hypothetical protein
MRECVRLSNHWNLRHSLLEFCGRFELPFVVHHLQHTGERFDVIQLGGGTAAACGVALLGGLAAARRLTVQKLSRLKEEGRGRWRTVFSF